METTPATPDIPTADETTAVPALSPDSAAVSDALVAWLVEVAAGDAAG